MSPIINAKLLWIYQLCKMTGMEFAPVRHALTITLVQQLSAHNNFDGLLINPFPSTMGMTRCQVCCLWNGTAWNFGRTRKFPRGPDGACIFVTADLPEGQLTKRIKGPHGSLEICAPSDWIWSKLLPLVKDDARSKRKPSTSAKPGISVYGCPVDASGLAMLEVQTSNRTYLG